MLKLDAYKVDPTKKELYVRFISADYLDEVCADGWKVIFGSPEEGASVDSYTQPKVVGNA